MKKVMGFGDAWPRPEVINITKTPGVVDLDEIRRKPWGPDQKENPKRQADTKPKLPGK